MGQNHLIAGDYTAFFKSPYVRYFERKGAILLRSNGKRARKEKATAADLVSIYRERARKHRPERSRKAVIWRPLTARPGGGFSARQPNITDGLTSPTRAPPQRSRAACKRRRKACPSAATANSALVPWERERGREVGRLALLAVAAAVAVVAVLVACSSSALPHCAAEGARSCGHKNSGGRAARKHHRRYVVPPPLTPAHRHPSHGNGPS